MSSSTNLLTTSRRAGENFSTSSVIDHSSSALKFLDPNSPVYQLFRNLEKIPRGSEEIPVYGRGEGGLMVGYTYVNGERVYKQALSTTQKVIESVARVELTLSEAEEISRTRGLLEGARNQRAQGDINRLQLNGEKLTENSRGLCPLLSRSPEDLISYPVDPKHFDKLEEIISEWGEVTDELIKENTPKTARQEYLFNHLEMNKSYMLILRRHTDLATRNNLPGYQVFLCKDRQKTAQALLLVRDHDHTLDVIAMIKNPKIFGDFDVEFGLINLAEEMARESGKSEVRAFPLHTYVWCFEERGYSCVENSIEMKKKL